MIPIFDSLDLRSASSVRALFDHGTSANLDASCRAGSIDVIDAPGKLIATGDLHDNPVHMARVVMHAGLSDPASVAGGHVTLHEIVHSDRLVGGMDFSFRALARAAALKAQFPEHVHVLLANHELAQVVGGGIVKDGIQVVEAFNDGVAQAFDEDADSVNASINAFIRSMPLALRVRTAGGDVLCAHSLPAPWKMDIFETEVLERDLVEEDYEVRYGSAYLMVWGRNHKPEQIESLRERWGVEAFILGHEKADDGLLRLSDRAVVLNSDHEHGVVLDLDLAKMPAGWAFEQCVRRLSDPV